MIDERSIVELERRHREGLTSSQIVEAFLAQGEKLSEATFRKWVQLGLLPRSRRVGRKGKHQGSLGLYPTSTVRRIAEIKRRMGEGLTIEDIQRAFAFRDEIEAIERALDDLWARFRGELSQAEAGEAKESGRLLDAAKRHAEETLKQIKVLERRITTPLVRAARARAFASGAGGGAGDLL
jgi:DNA-binding transcriptional MerR regulator